MYRVNQIISFVRSVRKLKKVEKPCYISVFDVGTIIPSAGKYNNTTARGRTISLVRVCVYMKYSRDK